MQDKFYQPNYTDDDVIAFNLNAMCKFGRFKQALQSAIESKLPDTLVEYLETQGITGIGIREYPSGAPRGVNHNRKWFSDGKDCEILSIGAGGWQKGKLRIKLTLEFCLDEPEVKQVTQSSEPENKRTESPLDDLRQMMIKDN